MRSPSLADSQEYAPGVIFQFPFGSPSGYPGRSARCPSSPLAGSDDGHNGANTTGAGRHTPPSHYPSPAASIRHLEHNNNNNSSGNNSNNANANNNNNGGSSSDLFAGQVTPASPLTRSGLGICVQEEEEDDEEYSESEVAPHPLDQPTQSSSSSAATATSTATSSNVLESGSLSMEIDPPASEPQKREGHIPTPPSTVMVPATQRMETTRENGNGNSNGIKSSLSPSPSPPPLRSSSSAPTRSTANVLGTPKSEKTLAEVESQTGAITKGSSCSSNGNDLTTGKERASVDQQQQQHEDEAEDNMSLIPLWAQRQLSIRRQSLIPRNELNFVTGSGILPPPSTDLVIPGGARIKTYPTLLSDIVKVQQEEQEEEAAAAAAAARHAEEEAEMASSGPKRRKASSAGHSNKGGRGSISTQDAAALVAREDAEDVLGHDSLAMMADLGGIRTRRFSLAMQGSGATDEGHHGSERSTTAGSRYNRRRVYGADDHEAFSPSRSPPAMMGHHDNDEYTTTTSTVTTVRPMKLGSPVELATNPFDDVDPAITGRRGSKGKNKTSRQTMVSGGGAATASAYRHQDPREPSWDGTPNMDADRHHHHHHQRQYYQHGGDVYSEKVAKKSGGVMKSTTSKKGRRRRNSIVSEDINGTDEDGDYVEGRRSFAHHSQHHAQQNHQTGYRIMASTPETDLARQRSDRGYSGAGAGAGGFKTLQPLLNATQFDNDVVVDDDELMNRGSGDRQFLLSSMGSGRGYGNSNGSIGSSSSSSSNNNNQNGSTGRAVASSKTSKKTGSPRNNSGGFLPGDAKRGRHSKSGEMRLLSNGPSDESMAMAEALMEMHHDGNMDDHPTDDETEDEYVPKSSCGRGSGRADYPYSDSQDEGRPAITSRPSNTKKNAGQKRKPSTKLASAGAAGTTATTTAGGYGATMSPQPKKKKITHGVDSPSSSKAKKSVKDHGSSSISSAGRQGGSSTSSPFDSVTGSGGGSGSRASSGSGSGSGSSSKHCEACGAKETPCWRPGYIPNTVLCNSCGLRYKKSNVFCTKVNCKYIPLKTEYASMEADRQDHGRDYLICIQCKGRVSLPIPKEEAA
ncbi:DNA-binding transcription repressor [Modicella reniformis]|uniref:DNA-binding transcription repressor n=1 Tax=Modicella reniformis TaxID=1440133 RepID=A0A9P6JA29_9FUNG|nr:DNA-binding transcription repressor [Modicella reniformis]